MGRQVTTALVLMSFFGLGITVGVSFHTSTAQAATSAQVYHIAPADKYPLLAPGIWGKALTHTPQGDVEVIDITHAAKHLHAHIDEVVYVISGRANGTIGTQSVTLNPGDVVVLPRGLPHSLVAQGATPVRLLGIAYPKDDPSDMKMMK